MPPFVAHYLLLNQTLRPGQSGWVEMKLALPNVWAVSDLSMRDGDPQNVSKLLYALLDGAPGRRPDAELVRLWHDYALHGR